MFESGLSLLDHWDSDTPVWTPYSPRQPSAAANTAISAAAPRCATRPNASRYPERADYRLEKDS